MVIKMNNKKLEINSIYCGDCVDVLRKFPPESVDLVYLDPPFFSNRNYEIIWGNGAELRSFQDRWKGGISSYIEWMSDRIEPMRTILKPTGSIYLHCDWHAGHYLKVMMDKIFDKKNFRNELVWFYKTGGASKKYFSRKHDTVFFYSKSDKYKFNHQKEKSYLSHKYGFKNVEIKKDDRGYYTNVGCRDVWDIAALRGNQPETLGYPTQKPEKLLERIIKASSNKGDIVLDPFLGGGTTTAVAHKLGRKWIGIDVSPIGCEVAKRRMEGIGATNVKIVGMKTIPQLRQMSPFAFQKWVCEKLAGTSSSSRTADGGIDGMTRDGIPIQVKQSMGVGVNVVRNFESAMRENKKRTGIIVAFSFTRGAYEKASKLKLEDNINIKLTEVSKLFGVLKKSSPFKKYIEPKNE